MKRVNYPFLSEEFNDFILMAYSHYVHLLGRDDADGFTTSSGVYDVQEDQMSATISRKIVLKNTETSVPKYLDKMSHNRILRRL